MRRSVALLLLALAACGRAPAPANTGETAPPPADWNNTAPSPSNMTGATAAPPPSAPMPMDQNTTMMLPDEAQTGGPRERFIVCPGNPRCPPSGNPPRNKPD